MTLERLILTKGSRQSERRSVWVDVARTEAADAELVRMIERRSRKGETDLDELEPGYMESVRRYQEKMRVQARYEWHLHHTAQAERLRRTLQALASYHEEQAAKLMGPGRMED